MTETRREHWRAQIRARDDGSVDTIRAYTGTAEECDGYARTLSGHGIGAYLIVKCG